MASEDEVLPMAHLEIAFQMFVYQGRPIRNYSGQALSEKQYEAYELMSQGMNSKQISEKMEVSRSSVLSMFTSIRKKGWAVE